MDMFYIVAKVQENGKFTPVSNEGIDRETAFKKANSAFLESKGTIKFGVFECELIHETKLVEPRASTKSKEDHLS